MDTNSILSNHSIEYVEWIVEARKSVFNSNVSGDEDLNRACQMISANVGLLLPSIEHANHTRFAREVMWHQMWAARDQDEMDLIETSNIVDDDGAVGRAASGQGTIFCTFHVGSYRLLTYILGAKGVPLSVIADREFIKTQAADAIEGYGHVQERFTGQRGEELEVLDAESGAMTVKAARRLKSGRSLVIYLDGNTGVGGLYARPNSLVSVNFFGQVIAARKGVGFLSYLTKSPVVPVLCVRNDWLQRELHFLKSIEAVRGVDRELYCETTTQHLYSILEEYVRKFPTQWEGWLYVHKFLIDDVRSVDEHERDEDEGEEYDESSRRLYIVDDRRFAVVSFSGRQMLFDKRTLSVQTLEDRLRRTLLEFSTPRELAQLDLKDVIVSVSALAELVEMGLLVAVEAVETDGFDSAAIIEHDG